MAGGIYDGLGATYKYKYKTNTNTNTNTKQIQIQSAHGRAVWRVVYMMG